MKEEIIDNKLKIVGFIVMKGFRSFDLKKVSYMTFYERDSEARFIFDQKEVTIPLELSEFKLIQEEYLKINLKEEKESL